MLLRIANLGYKQAAMTLTGIRDEGRGQGRHAAHGRDGANTSYETDTLMLGAGESADAIFTAPAHSGGDGPDSYSSTTGRSRVRTTSPRRRRRARPPRSACTRPTRSAPSSSPTTTAVALTSAASERGPTMHPIDQEEGRHRARAAGLVRAAGSGRLASGSATRPEPRSEAPTRSGSPAPSKPGTSPTFTLEHQNRLHHRCRTATPPSCGATRCGKPASSTRARCSA